MAELILLQNHWAIATDISSASIMIPKPPFCIIWHNKLVPSKPSSPLSRVRVCHRSRSCPHASSTSEPSPSLSSLYNDQWWSVLNINITPPPYLLQNGFWWREEVGRVQPWPGMLSVTVPDPPGRAQLCQPWQYLLKETYNILKHFFKNINIIKSHEIKGWKCHLWWW